MVEAGIAKGKGGECGDKIQDIVGVLNVEEACKNSEVQSRVAALPDHCRVTEENYLYRGNPCAYGSTIGVM